MVMNFFIRRFWFHGLSLVVLCLLAGCQTMKSPPPNVQALAEQTFPGRDPIYFHVSSHGAVGDAAWSAMSVATPSARAQELAEIFQAAVTRRTEVVVYGENAEKIVEIVGGALSQQVGRLPGLHLLFVGDERYRSRLANLLSRYNAHLHY